MKRRNLLLAGAALALMPAAAMAHGPTRQKVTVTADVAAEPAEVWGAIGDFQDMSWHPAVVSQEGTGGNEIDATRALYLSDQGASGPRIDEVLYKYSAEKMSYSYRITDVAVEVLPVTNYSSHLTVLPREGGGSTVEWRGAFYRGYPNNDPPPELNDEAAIAAVTGVYQAGLDALVERFGAPGS
ncbi:MULTISPECIES: SRPBCC family protein [unclassified Salipiger]|uniref:SRPBCC family protein n=1 Tax=unclassified Salipiger TaxID=2640570 RepID=UPI0013BBAEEA|nr:MULTISPECIES: SRPBCC family protein [unclassified Salipiger]NDV52717.1 SRPBCC family protein [Salipiger sp. PrR003]NDW34295.1 SRPBCC family protein [Salipiger sp. PrR007]